MDCFLKGDCAAIVASRGNSASARIRATAAQSRKYGDPGCSRWLGSGAIRRAGPAYHAMVTIVLEHDVNRRRTLTPVPEPAAVEQPRATGPQPPTAPVRDAEGAMVQLTKLAELRTAGVITEEEFAAKKADLSEENLSWAGAQKPGKTSRGRLLTKTE